MRPCLVVALLAIPACSTPRDSLPDVASIYREAALHSAHNPVIVIHGVLGARLQERTTGRAVWGAFTGDFADPATAAGSRAIALPIATTPAAAEIPDPEPAAVVATGPLETLELSLLFNIISVDVYKNIIRTLGAGGYRDELFAASYAPKYADHHFTCHSFWYDWRRDNASNAIRLGRYLRKLRKQIERDARARLARLRADPSADRLRDADELEAWLERGFRFDLVAHSMGGLIARYYLRYGEQDLPADGAAPTVSWAGAAEVGRLIMVGTPNLGSMGALQQLIEGFQLSYLLPHYDQVVLGSMPSIYQLLPRSRHQVLLDAAFQPTGEDLLDPDLWDRNDWGLLDPAAAQTLEWLLPEVKDPQQRRARALAYLRWCLDRARQFQRALDQEPGSRCPAEVYLFAADSQPTLAKAVLQVRDGRTLPVFPDAAQLRVPGDVSVPRYSAIGDERQGGPFRFGVRSILGLRNVTFLSDDHLGLTRNPHFTNNLLHILLERTPRRR